MSGAVDPKPLQYDLESLGFTLNVAEPEMGKEVRRQRSAHRKTEKIESK